MRRGAVLLAAIVIVTPAFADFQARDLAELQDRHITTERGALVLPAKSPLRPAHLPTRNRDYFEFKGQFVVSGTYHYDNEEYQEPKRHKSVGYTVVFLDLDKQYMDQLPHLKFQDGAQERVEQIRFDNENAFLKAVVSTGDLHKMRNKQQNSVSGHVTLLLDNLRFTSDCGYLWTSAHFVSVQREPTIIASNADAGYGC